MRAATAAVVRRPGAFDLEPIEIDAPRQHEVLVRIVGCGLCHTDLSARDQDLPFKLPAILGHEGSGIVEQVGAGVTRLRPGDAVVLSYAYCGDCEYCQDDRMAYCTRNARLNFGGVRVDGSALARDRQGQPLSARFIGQSAFATHALVLESNAIRVPTDVPLELMGPLGCSMQTGAGAVINALKPGRGESIAIFGAGSVGLSAIMAARIAGCATIIAIDKNAGRLGIAAELGATLTINTQVEDALVAIRAATKGRGVHYSVECTGAPAVLRQAVDSLRACGVCASLGVAGHQAEVQLHMNRFLFGKTLRGVTEGDSVPQRFIPQLIDWWRDGTFPFDRLVSYFSLAQLNEAAAACASGLAIKAIVQPPHTS
ncbi:NAD(P)-dependent alcohol dehydrogenase [Peristeroidobacter agariperforans]|uniref:NAD(P)-dependent alcohol dehydrogenase n=1 Tax=Peristeroidobacter agariperforans TaxID=268404 RepID=UPI00101D7F73|nr:NAD(P)-dependent alcohol dehydrogenase [Peristeroidobacter agariperforans]